MLPLLLTIPFLNNASACECFARSIESMIQENDVIFMGQVSKIEVLSELHQSVEFEVTKIWKGEFTNNISIKKSITSCDVDFEEGKPYLVMANYYDNELRTSICSGTKPLEFAIKSGIIQILNEPFIIPFYIQIFVIIVVGAVLIIPAFLIWRKRK